MTYTVERVRYLRKLQETVYGVSFDQLPHQAPPEGDWYFWLLQAGRGAGKTTAAAHAVTDHVNGPPCISKELPHRVALIAPTIGDGIESASLNDQALTRLDRTARLTSSAGGSRIEYANGSQVRIFGTHTRDDIDRLRAGGNRCFVWAEEVASWRYLKTAWEIMEFGLRLGDNPRIIATTTPKARPAYVELSKEADVITSATMFDNPNLNEKQKQRLLDKYDGTSIGVQELYGKLIEEAEGAIWHIAVIESNRLLDLLEAPEIEEGSENADDETDTPLSVLGRTVVAVDPPGGATEAGIVVAAALPFCPCGGPRLPHFAVLEDGSGKLTPNGWGKRSVRLLAEWEGDRIVGESNYGGDMVEAQIRNVDKSASYKNVHASKGKKLRAEPIFGLYEQGRVHHVDVFPELEAEMVQWIPDESEWSPNRLDALVWALTELSGGITLDGDMMV